MSSFRNKIVAGFVILILLVASFVWGYRCGQPDKSLNTHSNKNNFATNEKASMPVMPDLNSETTPRISQDIHLKAEEKRKDLETDKIVQRYNVFRENFLTQNGHFYLRLSDTLQPNKEMINFLGLSEDEKNKICQIGRDTLSRVQQWEGENAKIIQQSDQVLAYEIPSTPEWVQEEKERYLSAIQGIVGDDSAFFEASGKEFFDNFQNKQIVKYTIDGDKTTFEIRYYDSSGRARGSSSTSGNYVPGMRINERYSRLFVEAK